MIELLKPVEFEVEIEGSRFKLKELNREERAYFLNEYAQQGKKISDQKNYDLALEMVQKCLIGWSNVIDSQDKKEIPFNSDLIEWLPAMIIGQLANSIMEKMRIRIDREIKSQKNLKTTSDDRK